MDDKFTVYSDTVHSELVIHIVHNVEEFTKNVSDLPDHTAPGGGLIPPELCVTVQKPDKVIINKHSKTIHLFELTCPLEKHIDTIAPGER